MAEKTSLKEFVAAYVENKKKSESEESYQKWLSANGIDSAGIYGESIRDISSDYEKRRSEFGKNAEGLADIGLTASGYSDYINAAAYSEMQRRKAGAKAKLTENEAENRKGFSDYVEKMRESEEAAYASVIDKLRSDGITDFDTAYEYAVSVGLSEEAAKAAAESGTGLATRELFQKVLDTIISKSFNAKQAKSYALAAGLSQKDADMISAYAKNINEYGYYSDGYLDYIQSKGNNK